DQDRAAQGSRRGIAREEVAQEAEDQRDDFSGPREAVPDGAEDTGAVYLDLRERADQPDHLLAFRPLHGLCGGYHTDRGPLALSLDLEIQRLVRVSLDDGDELAPVVDRLPARYEDAVPRTDPGFRRGLSGDDVADDRLVDRAELRGEQRLRRVVRRDLDRDRRRAVEVDRRRARARGQHRHLEVAPVVDPLPIE